MKFYGIKQGDKINIEWSSVKKYLMKLADGELFRLEIKKREKIRSLEQNKLYWFWLNFIAQELGYEKYETELIHERFKNLFLLDESRKIALPKSTTGLTVPEFISYLNKIEKYCRIELGIILPQEEDLIEIESNYEIKNNYVFSKN